MSSVEYQRPWLADYQIESLFHPHRYGIVEGSTKCGKTAPALVWLAEQAMAGQAGQNYWWGAPVYAQAEIAYRRMVRGFPRELIKTHDNPPYIDLVNETRIWFKSAEKPDNLYGEDVYAAVADEASRWREDSWYALRSTLTATRGKVRIIGNVKGRRNWAYQLARRAEAGEEGYIYRKVTAYDAVAAGILDAQEVEDAKRDLPDQVFRELYLAEPSEDAGNPFGGDNAIGACIRPLSTAAPVVWGVDLAKHVDWTVLIALDADDNVCRLHRWQKEGWERTTERVIEYCGSTPTLVDSTGVGDPILERLQKVQGAKFEGYQFTAPSKQKLMEGLAVAIQREEVFFPEGPIAIELRTFEYEVNRTTVRYSAPEGLHDDCVCALALAVMHKSHARAPMRISANVLARSTQRPAFQFRL